MITLVFMTDPKRVIGGSSRLRNLLRIPFLPMGELPGAMDRIMAGQRMVIGSGSAGFYAGRAAQYEEAWLLTRNPRPKRPGRSLKVCNEVHQLVDRYRASPDELLVLGGLSVWKAFLPHAKRIRTAETYREVPGDLVFDEWDRGEFELVDEQRGKKLAVREYRRIAKKGQQNT